MAAKPISGDPVGLARILQQITQQQTPTPAAQAPSAPSTSPAPSAPSSSPSSDAPVQAGPATLQYAKQHNIDLGESDPSGYTSGKSNTFPGIEAALAAAKNNTGQQSSSFVSPLALQMFFAQTIAPLLEKIQGNQSQVIDQFKAAGGKVDPRQLASMQNVNNAMAGSAVTAPAVDALIGQLNQTLNAQQKAYYESLRASSLGGGGTDLTTQIQALLGSGAAPAATSGG